MTARGSGLGPSRGLLRRVALPALATLAMLQVVVWLLPHHADSHDFREVGVHPVDGPMEPIEVEAGVFRDLRASEERVAITEPAPHIVVRGLEVRRLRRAYPGAPPFIPHELSRDLERSQDCRPCHGYGGYSPDLASYAPRTPHARLTNCMQCHVPSTDAAPFRPQDWPDPEWPALGQTDLPGGPPIIPHRMEMRWNCLACHAGPSAAPEIRTDHPELINCRQCHVEQVSPGAMFVRPRPGTEGG